MKVPNQNIGKIVHVARKTNKKTDLKVKSFAKTKQTEKIFPTKNLKRRKVKEYLRVFRKHKESARERERERDSNDKEREEK